MQRLSEPTDGVVQALGLETVTLDTVAVVDRWWEHAPRNRRVPAGASVDADQRPVGVRNGIDLVIASDDLDAAVDDDSSTRVSVDDPPHHPRVSSLPEAPA